MAHKNDIPKDVFVRVAKESSSISELLSKVGQPVWGGSYMRAHRLAKKYGVSFDHFKGQAHGKSGALGAPKRRIPLTEILVRESTYVGTSYLKKRLVNEGILTNKCALCANTGEWQGKELVLRLDHINGIRDDNRRRNLRLLCPNCDSQTSTFCGRNKGRLHR